MPASTPSPEIISVPLSSTQDAAPLAQLIREGLLAQTPTLQIQLDYARQDQLTQQLVSGHLDYFIGHHFPTLQERTLWAGPLAQDGIVVFTHPANPITNLTTEEIRRIFRGFSLNWGEFGGADAPIQLYSREAGAAIRLEFERMVMGQRRISPNARVLTSTQALFERIAADPHGIGYAPLSILPDSVQAVAVDGSTPTRDTIESNRYPLRITLYLIGLSPPEAPYVSVLDWTQSLNGQRIIIERYAGLPR